MQDAGRHLRDRRLRPRASWRPTRISTSWSCAPKTPGPRRAGAGRGDPVPAVGRQGRRRARRPLVRPGAVAAGARSGGRHRAARRALPDRRRGAGRQASWTRSARASPRPPPRTSWPACAPSRRARHSRFGDTIFLLEPDLKNGPGGMRDLCVGRWAAMARFGTSDPRELQAKGVMTGRLAAAFTAATEWLLRVRIADARARPGAGRTTCASRCRRRSRRCSAPTRSDRRRRHPPGGRTRRSRR